MGHELYKILQHGFVEHANPPKGKENAAYVLSKVLAIIAIFSSQYNFLFCYMCSIVSPTIIFSIDLIVADAF